jgi:hypothetical protein
MLETAMALIVGSGHAAAPPSSMMNSRRLMWDMDLQRVSIGNTA